MSIVIRQAKRGDEAQILSFIRALADYEKLSDEVAATSDHLRQTLFSAHPKAFALIAEIDDEPVGFAIYFFNFSTFLGKHGLYLEDLYVREARRGAGVGKALLARLAQIALEHDCGRMEWSVLDWNAPSIALYKSLGANPMDEWTVYRLKGEALDKLAAGGGA